MDTKQLKASLREFQVACERRGYPFSDFCLVEAYPGDNSSSYCLEIKAPWVDGQPCSDILDNLFDILFKTTTVEIRKKIFSIQLLDSDDSLHCDSTPIHELEGN